MRPDPHVFVPDPDQPPDRAGRRMCRHCHLVGRPDDGHHATPELLHDRPEYLIAPIIRRDQQRRDER